MTETSKITVTKLPRTQTLIIKQSGGKDFFVSSDDVIVIDAASLAFLLKFLVQANYLSARLLEGILSEIKE